MLFCVTGHISFRSGSKLTRNTNFQNYMLKALNVNFSNENLDLDYLVFNLTRFRTQMLKVAKIFRKYGFNFRNYSANTEKYSTILYEKTFIHWLTFTLENELWNKDNLYIHFKVSNSRRIYFLSKKEFCLFLNWIVPA